MLVTLILFLAIFVQATTGFGLALVSMPLLVATVGIQVAAPLVALIALLGELAILIRYREALTLRAVALATGAGLFGVPLGILFLRRVDERPVTLLLGVLLLSYALYALFSPRLPRLEHPGWAAGLGFLGGLLSGAYNTGGPPIIIYGTCRRWEPAAFKSNLQGYFLVIGLMTLGGHVFNGMFTPVVWHHVLYALPGAALGLIAGLGLGERIDPRRFRQAVFLLLAVLGVRLLVG